MDVILQALLNWLLAALVIFIVGRIGLGLVVDGFVPALIAAAVIAIVAAIVNWLLGVLGITIAGGWFGALISLIIAALVLLVSDRFVKGMKVNGFVGALIAAIAIGIVAWLVNWVLGLFF